MRVYIQAALLLLSVFVGHAQNVSGPGTNAGLTSSARSKMKFGASVNSFSASMGVCAAAVITVLLLLCYATRWANVRRRTRVASVTDAPEQVEPERRLEQLKPEPFIPVVVVAPNNEVVIARQADAPRKGAIQSPFQQMGQDLQSQPSFSRGRVMPLWLETVLSQQRSAASIDDIEAQKGEASFSNRSAALRANSSRLASLMRLGSALTTRQSSADTAAALDDQMVPAPERMPGGEQSQGGGEPPEEAGRHGPQ